MGSAAWYSDESRRDGRVVEGARLESVYRGNSIEGSNPSLSASFQNPSCQGRRPWNFLYFQSSKVSIVRTAREARSATRPPSRTPPSSLGAVVYAVPPRPAQGRDRPLGWLA